MPRPRFHTLPDPQQALIIDAALDEFATHGYGRASLNQIIAAAGISKGSMYYYFNDKEDLYAYAIRDQLESMLEQAGPFPIPTEVDVDGFWTTLENYYSQVMRTLGSSPRLSKLLRNWRSDQMAPNLVDAEREASQDLLPWVAHAVTTGQQIGAVRSDVPTELLTGIAVSMAEALDLWLVTGAPEEVHLAEDIHAVMGMIRRAISPA